jgi:hypothetical protein
MTKATINSKIRYATTTKTSGYVTLRFTPRDIRIKDTKTNSN